MNIWIQCGQFERVSPDNPLGLIYRNGYDYITSQLAPRVGGRRVMFHLPWGRPYSGTMPFDGHYLAQTLAKDTYKAILDSFLDSAETLYAAGATEILVYTGSIQACARINTQFGRPRRADDIDRILYQLTRLPKEGDCSLVFDAAGSIFKDWHFHYLKLQQAELAFWGRNVYVEATPYCTLKADTYHKNFDDSKMKSVFIDGKEYRAARTYNEFPMFVLEDTFVKRHVKGYHVHFPLLNEPSWYTQQVNVLHSSADHKTKTTPEIVQAILERENQGVEIFVNVPLLDRLEPLDA